MSRPALSPSQIQSFERDGFLALTTLLDIEDLREIEKEYEELLDKVAYRLLSENKISDSYNDLPFGHRYSRIIGEYPELHRFFNVSLPLLNKDINPSTFHMHSGPAVFNLMRHPKILDVVECIIGSEIYSSPVQQMRMKPPENSVPSSLSGHSNVGATTWHQDLVALLPEADDTEQLTVWLAITEATVKNGCLASISGSHKQGAQVHCSNATLASEPHVPNSITSKHEPVPLPIEKGGIILFHKMNMHCALANISNDLRWSLDLRYHPIGQATGRPAFPGFIARSRKNPETELHDPSLWAQSWENARQDILTGEYQGRIFEDTRWNDSAVC